MKLLYKIVDRANYHAYVGAGANSQTYTAEYTYTMPSTTSSSSLSLSGIGFDLFVGVEYFLAGIPDLGFSLEWGLSSVSLSPSEGEGTITLSATPLRLAAHLYFGDN